MEGKLERTRAQAPGGREGSAGRSVRAARRALELATLLLVFGLYLWGVDRLPFHPDEATWTYTSRDWDLLLQGRWRDLCWQPMAVGTPGQEERARVAPLPRYVIGLTRSLAGGAADAPTRDWDWSASWEDNVTGGAMPGPLSLPLARLPMALLAAVSVAVLLRIGRGMGGTAAGVTAALLMGLNALTLLHGRRAMSEGLLLFALALSMLVAIARKPRPVLLGAAVGIAIASKHSALTLLPVVIVALLWTNSDSTAGGESARGNRSGRKLGAWPRRAGRLLAGGASALLVFYALNPFLWCDPAAALRAVADARTFLLDQQVAALSVAAPGAVLSTPQARAAALLDQSFYAPPAFWELPNYVAQTRATEAAYLAQPWADLMRGPQWGTLLLILTVLGLVAGLADLARAARERRSAPLRSRVRERALVLVLVWTASTVAGILLLVPFPWQRYYLPLLQPLSLWAAYGAIFLVRALRRLVRLPRGNGDGGEKA